MNKELKKLLDELSLPENAEAQAYLKEIRVDLRAKQAEARQELLAKLAELKERQPGGGRKASSEDSGDESPKRKKKKKRNRE